MPNKYLLSKIMCRKEIHVEAIFLKKMEHWTRKHMLASIPMSLQVCPRNDTVARIQAMPHRKDEDTGAGCGWEESWN